MNTRKMIFKSALFLQILTVIQFGSVYAQEKKTDPNTIEYQITPGSILLNGSLVKDDKGIQSIELALLEPMNKYGLLRVRISLADIDTKLIGDNADLKLIGANQKGELFFYLTDPKVILVYGTDNKMSIVAPIHEYMETGMGFSKSTLAKSNEFNRFIVNSNGDLLFAAKDKRLFRIAKEGLEEIFRFPGSHTIICSLPARICVDSKNRAYAYAIDNNTFQYGLYLFEKDKKPELLTNVKTTISRYANKDQEIEWSKLVADPEVLDFFTVDPYYTSKGGNPGGHYQNLMADTMAFTLDPSDNLILPGKASITVKDEDGNDIQTRVSAIVSIDSNGKKTSLHVFNKELLFHPYLIYVLKDNLVAFSAEELLIFKSDELYYVDLVKSNYKPNYKILYPEGGPFGYEEKLAQWFQFFPAVRSLKVFALMRESEKQKPKFGDLEVEAK